MASNNTVTLIGNIIEPEAITTKTGKFLAKARMVVKTYGDADDMWVNVTAWEKLGENFFQTFQSQSNKSIRVSVTGRLVEEKWEDKNTGQERKSFSVTADNIGVMLDYQTCGGIQYSGEAKQESTYSGDKVAMASEILNAEPVARTDYGENEAPF
jgi:single-stranded DNA-binding protein